MLSEAVKAKPESIERRMKSAEARDAGGIYPNNLYVRYGKRSLDVTGALLVAAMLLPVICLVACLVRMQGRNVIFGHERVGRDGRHFRCFKFRSMVPDAETRLRELLERDPAARAEWEEHHKLDNDPRITRLGQTLRRTSLDELPQLWNVLRGDMSLVGPRPVTPTELTERYGDHAGAYQTVRPGVTGAWQVSGRNNLSYEQRVRLDRDYARDHSLTGDLSILIRTVKVVVAPNGK
ncbi:sugar transferase [Paracoccus limosus]|jgi:lipopolysaccharide/colanic/teichoic acid biosynthesis glycosyltransferase|nr:sugar transferase [Paracoccus limosus]